MAVVKNLMVRAGADFSGMRSEMKKAQKDLADFKAGISRTIKGIAATLATLGIGSFIKDAVNDANTFEASLQQIDRQMGRSAESFKQWAKDNAASFGMSRLEAIKYGAVYGNLISTFSAGAEDTTQKTEQLLKASAVIASSTGRTIEDTMDRIRSGLLGETDAIEDLGINVNVAMIESTNAFKQFANGQHWNQLSFQTQQQIRLMAILEQANQKYGSEIANNTIARQQQLIAQLKNVRLSLGQAFQPIWNYILPSLITFATALARVADFIAQFTRALFGGTQTTKQQVQQTNAQASAVSGLGDAYEKTGKKAKKASRQAASFDQLNLIGSSKSADDSADNPGGGSPSGGVGGIDPGALGGLGEAFGGVSEKAQAMADKVKAAFAAMKNFIVQNKDIIIAALAALATAFAGFWLATKWGAIVESFQNAGKAIMAVLTRVPLPIAAIILAIAALVGAFVYFYRTNETFRELVNSILEKIGETAKWLWENVMVPFGKWLASGMVAAWQAVGDASQWLWNSVLKPLGSWLADVMPKAWKAVQDAAQWLWKNVLVPFGDFLLWMWKNVITPLAKILTDALGVAFKFVADVSKSFWQNVLIPLGKALSEMFGPAVEAVSAVLTFLWKNVFTPLASFLGSTMKPAFSAVIDVITFLWKNVLKPLTEFVSGTLMIVFDNTFKAIGGVITGLKTTFIGLMTFITGVFTGDWKKAWEGVKGIFKGVFDSLYEVVKWPLNMIIDAINKVIGGLNKIDIDLPDWMGGQSFGIDIKPIPKLAKGGLAFGPTLAMVGDNRGASSDPEVIAPLSKLEGMLDGGDNREVVTVLRSIQRAIESGQNITVAVSRKEIGQAAIAEIKDTARRTGQVPFPV